MDHQFGNFFVFNTLISRLDLKENLYFLVLGWLVYNFFTVRQVKDFFSVWFEKPQKYKPEVNIVKVVNYVDKDGYSIAGSRFLALMEYINGLDQVKESITCRSTSLENDCNGYQVCQQDNFLIDPEKNIYGRVITETISDKEKTTEKRILEISSCKTSHKNLIKWIEYIYENWDYKNKAGLQDGTLFIWDVWWKNGTTCRFRKFNQNTASFDNTFFPGKPLLIKELDNFINNGDKWDQMGQPRQLGIALTGDRGTGKTRVVKCIAKYTQRHIINIQLTEFLNTDMINLEKVMFGVIGNLVLRPNEFIIVFEEISDQTYLVGPRDEEFFSENPEEKRNFEEKLEKRRNFLSKFLQILDGISERRNGMVIMTTNYIDRLDSALIRPGRIDFHLHMTGGYDRKTTWEVIYNWWGKDLDEYDQEMIKEEIVGKYNGSEIVQKCKSMEKEEFIKHFFQLE